MKLYGHLPNGGDVFQVTIESNDQGWGEFPYKEYAGIALEPQIWPDSPNQNGFPNPYLSPHEKYKHHTRLNFSNSKDKK